MTALLSSPLTAFAQDEQRSAARDLATAGVEAFKDQKYDVALDNFTKAESLFHALPHLLFIARSHVKLGQYVKAREAYMKIIKEVLPGNAPQAARDAQSSASTEVGNIEPKIGRVTINVAGKEQAKGLVVTIDGTPIASVLVGVPTAIDPGDHVIEGVATGLRGKAYVTVQQGQKQDVALKLEADASAVPPAPVAAPLPAAGAAPAPAAAPPPPQSTLPPPVESTPPADQGASHGSNGLRIGSYVAFGVGALGLAGGTVFMLQSAGKRSDADKLCTLPGGECDTSVESKVKSLDSDADSAATLGIVGFAVGAVGIGAGITLLVLSSKKSESASTTTVTPWIGLRTAGVRGTF
jgi:hypothetical protein